MYMSKLNETLNLLSLLLYYNYSLNKSVISILVHFAFKKVHSKNNLVIVTNILVSWVSILEEDGVDYPPPHFWEGGGG